ncbi:unnamed protein product [Ectocarpus sp. CCAP 1310/34]|nr:unnamed protein product [Ectocarpus sp. CCAP 1310/34]
MISSRGRAVAQPQESVDRSPLATFLLSGSREQHLVFTELDGAGPHLAHLTPTVHFSITAGHSLERAGGPMQVRKDGRVYVAVKCPSISELWPEIYNNRSIRVVQVDVYVTV